MTRRRILLALLPPLFFGTGFTIAKPAVAHFPPLFMMLMVYFGIALVLILSHPGRLRTPWPQAMIIASLAVTLQGALLFWGLSLVPASTANLVLQIQIPFAILLDWLIMKEALNARKLTGTALAIAGVAVVIGLPEQPPALLPVTAIIAGGFIWALGQVLARKWSRDSGIGLLKANAIYSVPQLALATVLLESGQMTSLRTATALEWSMLAFVGVVGFYLANLCWFTLLKQCRMDDVAPFILLMPVVGLMTAFLVLGETVSCVQLAGGAAILTGLAIVSGLGPFTTKGRASGAALE